MKALLFLFCSIFPFAQNLTGSVVTEASTPVPDASVYVDGSRISATTDAQGIFSLNIMSLSGGSLIIKKEGYETVVYPFKSNDLKRLKVILTKEKTIEEVKLLHFSDKMAAKYMSRFLNEFLGYERTDVNILNQKDILFAYDKDAKTLKAKARKSLIIENKNLGYEVVYDLAGFEINDNQQSITYSGTTFFREMKGSKKQILQWEVNRLNAYYGSPQHFFRSIYNQKANENGFILNRIVRMDNPKYPNESELLRLKKYNDSLRKLPNNLMNLRIPHEIADIQSRKFHESKYILALTESKMPDEKVLQQKAGRVYFTFKDWLGVVYRKNLYAADHNKIIKMPSTTIVSAKIDTGGNVFEIFPDGNYSDPEQMMFMDDWAKQKNAMLLPLDYIPNF